MQLLLEQPQQHGRDEWLKQRVPDLAKSLSISSISTSNSLPELDVSLAASPDTHTIRLTFWEVAWRGKPFLHMN